METNPKRGLRITSHVVLLEWLLMKIITPYAKTGIIKLLELKVVIKL